jgi:tripartite ATP-independent transporter DctM subunit
MLIVMGPVLGVSVGALYAAAIIPGVMLASLYIAYCMIRCFLNPKLGPPLPVEERATSYGQMVREFLLGIIPLGSVIFAALGSILMGWATATEAGAMGAVGSLALMLLYRRFKLGLIMDALYKTLQTSSMVLFLATTANVFGAVFTKLGTGTIIAKWLVALPISPFAMLILLMFLIFLLGWPLEWPPIIFIFVPILLPVITMMKYDMVWFGTLLAVNLQTAFLSPPVAVSAYYLKGVAPKWDIKDIYIGMGQFMVLQVIGLVIVLFFPVVALWLPTLLYK